MALFDFGKNEDNIVEHNHKAITAGSVVKYMVLPRILPRLAEFISTGFKTFAFFMACVLSTIRLIPASHEYLRPHNIGKFGIIQVLAAAANNLEFRKDKADQIIIFGIVVTALALLALQIFTLLVTFVMTPAFAQIANVFDPYPAFVPAGAGVGVGADGRYDIAMILLDRIFGVPGLFDSCVSILQPCTGINADGTNAVNEVQSTANTFPWPFHRGLHNMYLLYSLALKEIVSQIRYVDLVIPLNGLLYPELVKIIKADYFVHGTDWRSGPQKKVRKKLFDEMKRINGKVVEIPYTKGISSTKLKRKLEKSHKL